MAEEKTITPKNFALLLNWLDTDQDRAAEKYENIRRRLIKVLAGRGCHEAESLADLTIDRVTLKVPQIRGNFVGEPAAYFYGVVHNVHLEWLRQQKRARENTPTVAVVVDSKEVREAEFRCLESCLAKLATNVRMMVIEYYRDEKKAKIERRKRLSERLGISNTALRIKMSRVRNTILECVRQCLAETQ
jgi:DNA-directed RNA polymerase specialized sigma24 family protein